MAVSGQPSAIGRSDLRERHGTGLAIPRSRGAASGFLLVLLGIWGAIIPFIGPYFGYTFGVTAPWFFTYDRLWLSIVPGIAVFLGGLILGTTTNRASGEMGAWLALVGGIWFTIGPVVSQLWRVSGLGTPIGTPLGAQWMHVLEQLGYFYGLGAVITALAGIALGRMTTRAV